MLTLLVYRFNVFDKISEGILSKLINGMICSHRVY